MIVGYAQRTDCASAIYKTSRATFLQFACFESMGILELQIVGKQSSICESKVQSAATLVFGGRQVLCPFVEGHLGPYALFTGIAPAVVEKGAWAVQAGMHISGRDLIMTARSLVLDESQVECNDGQYAAVTGIVPRCVIRLVHCPATSECARICL